MVNLSAAQGMLVNNSNNPGAQNPATTSWSAGYARAGGGRPGLSSVNYSGAAGGAAPKDMLKPPDIGLCLAAWDCGLELWSPVEL